MKNVTLHETIESSFRNQANNDKRVRNAYLLVYSEKLKVDLKIAEGATDNFKADSNQPIHLASVGKLFTATIISILHERKQLDFNDSITKYIDSYLMRRLHVFKGKDYSDQITIRHLLMQTSGLNDVFFPLLKE